MTNRETSTVQVVKTIEEQTDVGQSTVQIVETIDKLGESQDID